MWWVTQSTPSQDAKPYIQVLVCSFEWLNLVLSSVICVLNCTCRFWRSLTNVWHNLRHFRCAFVFVRVGQCWGLQTQWWSWERLKCQGTSSWITSQPWEKAHLGIQLTHINYWWSVVEVVFFFLLSFLNLVSFFSFLHISPLFPETGKLVVLEQVQPNAKIVFIFTTSFCFFYFPYFTLRFTSLSPIMYTQILRQICGCAVMAIVGDFENPLKFSHMWYGFEIRKRS